MKKRLLFLIICSISITSFAQDIERIEVNGKIVVKSDDVEGVTVYNTSSEEGTVTDFNGNFKIKVGLNDRVEVSALQFQKFTVIVDEGIISEKKMTLYLIEQINKLPEVLVSPYDMSGNIIVDVARVKTTNLPFKKGEFDTNKVPVDLTVDYKSGVNNPFVTGAGGATDQLGGNVVGLVGLLLKPLLKRKNKKAKSQENNFPSVGNPQDDIFDLRLMYTNKEFSELLKIPEESVNEFIAYMEKDGLDYSLLKQGRELEFIDFLVLESKSFLALKSDKD